MPRCCIGYCRLKPILRWLNKAPIAAISQDILNHEHCALHIRTTSRWHSLFLMKNVPVRARVPNMNFASFAFKSTLSFLKSFPPCSQMFRHYCPNLHFDGNLNSGAQVYVQNGLNLQSRFSDIGDIVPQKWVQWTHRSIKC